MPEQIPEAVTIALAGIAIVLVALTILMLAIMLLRRLSPAENQDKKPAPRGVQQQQSPSKETIAAMAVAMALAMDREENASAIGPRRTPVPRPAVSPWAAAGRERLMRSRAKPGHRWGRSSD